GATLPLDDLAGASCVRVQLQDDGDLPLRLVEGQHFLGAVVLSPEEHTVGQERAAGAGGEAARVAEIAWAEAEDLAGSPGGVNDVATVGDFLQVGVIYFTWPGQFVLPGRGNDLAFRPPPLAEKAIAAHGKETVAVGRKRHSVNRLPVEL